MRRPSDPVTLCLVALCVAWTLGALWLDLTYLGAGALSYRLLWEGQYWRLLSAMLLHHRGLYAVHLVTNTISLFFVGRVIERACGGRVVLAFVVGAGMAGFAASLVSVPDPTMLRMGISGGIAGLLGLLLAVEWAITRSLWEFLRQRNTLLIFFFVGLSFPLALLFESRVPGLQVDHAGHAGGFAFGLLTGLCTFTRRGPRPRLGIAIGVLLSVLPVAYASRPFLDPGYQYWRAERAFRAGDLEDAAERYQRALKLDPAAPWAGDAREALLDLRLQEAAMRLGDPEAARLVETARALGVPRPMPWVRFAEAAEAKEQWDLAYGAWREAAALLGDKEAWPSFAQALRILRKRPEPPLAELIAVARGAVKGLRPSVAQRTRLVLEADVAAAADDASRMALAARPGEGVAQDLAELYRALAENAPEDARKPRYRVRSADWLWRGTGGAEAPDEVKARFRAAITEAALYGDAKAREEAEAWFRDRGLPVPEPDLEGEEGGG